MYPGGYTAEVTNLSPKATEKDVYDFFANCGVIEHLEIIGSGEYSCTSYVTFKDPYALATALLLNGSVIVDQCVCISHSGSYVDESDAWNSPAWNPEEHMCSADIHTEKLMSTPGEAVTMAQVVVKTMVAKGYVLGKDALIKAKEFDESLHASSTAASMVAELSNKIGLTETINSGMETFKSVDQKFHVSDFAKSATTVTGTAAIVVATITGRAAIATSKAVVNSSYFAKGSLWVSDLLNRAAKAAADLGTQSHK
ncbi:binding partner of ACD11 1 [Quillaja saponaria]|uniref:Binding partner of ACD11 1 n=1 Tax=Quillaja saponaria TaxID=32244 RepID=A0AAD7PXF8_QUISA|nr:binding partner of ACD11 1 [Quillaja saponaria]